MVEQYGDIGGLSPLVFGPLGPGMSKATRGTTGPVPTVQPSSMPPQHMARLSFEDDSHRTNRRSQAEDGAGARPDLYIL